MIFLFRLFFIVCTVVLLPVSLWQCSESNIKNTSFLKKITKPIIDSIENTGDKIKIQSTQKYESEQSDIQNIIVIGDSAGGTFSKFNDKDLSDLSKISEIPLFKGSTEDLKLSGKIFSIETTIGSDGFEVGKDYKIALITQGSNDFYRKAYKNNGWFFSPKSEELDIYVSQKNDKTLNNFHYIKKNLPNAFFYGFTIEKTSPFLKTTCVNTDGNEQDPAKSTCDIVFLLHNNNSFSPHLTTPCVGNNNNTQGMYPFYTNNGNNLMQNPSEKENVYLCDEKIPVSDGNILMGKKADLYFRIFIKKITGSIAKEDDNVSIDLSIFIQPIEKKMTF